MRKPNQAIYYSYIINNYIDYINIQLCNNFKISSRINVAKDLLNAFAEIILETFERDVDYEKFIKRIDTDRHILIR